ncbi:MAG: glycosyltransferase family 39 protein, partial [Candidatus Paceibacteria bacterium]
MTDVSHDYFYNGLLILDGYVPDARRHPGTPLFYFIFFLQWIIAGSVSETINKAGPILSFGMLGISLVSTIVIYIFSRPVIKYDVGFSILSVLVLLGSPSFLYYTTQFGPDLLTPVFALAACLILYKYIIIDDGLDILYLGIICGIGMSLKMSFGIILPPIVFALLTPKNLDQFGSGGYKKYAFSAFLGPLISIIISNGGGPSLSIFTLDVGVFSVLVISYVFLPILVLIFSIFYYNITESDQRIWSLVFFSGLIVIPLFIKRLLSGHLHPVIFRQITPGLVIFVWSMLLLISTQEKVDININKFTNHKSKVYILITIYMLITSGVIAYNIIEIDEEYEIGQEATSLINSSTRQEDGRVAHTAWYPEVGFHFHGNEYAHGQFSNLLLNMYPDST